ncbi:MAG: CoA pyrophosphatase [Gemmatimonadetes bacterium]|nr:MAG: CoA pyrophosphatase [Gemmatimonadota bacterium]
MNVLGPDADPRLQRLRARLESALPESALLPGAASHNHAQAAVSLVLRMRDEPDLLLIKRARSEHDPWSGHMALPGGRRDDGDPSLVHTAVRETHEETGLRLDPGAVLGALGPAKPGGPRLPRIVIAPFVFATAPDSEAWVNSAEVESVLWVPVPLLRSPEARGTTRIMAPGGPRSFPCFNVYGETVWGLTYRILADFLVRLP